MYERYHPLEHYKKGYEFNFDPFTFKLADDVENIRVKVLEKWLVSLRNHFSKLLQRLANHFSRPLWRLTNHFSRTFTLIFST